MCPKRTSGQKRQRIRTSHIFGFSNLAIPQRRCTIYGDNNMFRTLPLRIRLTLSAIISIASVAVLATLSVYSLWQSELELERQIKATEAVRQELTADMEHEALEATVVYSILRGPDASAAKREEILAGFKEDTERFQTALTTLAAMDLSPGIQKVIGGLEEPAAEFIERGQKIMEIAFTDRDQALKELGAFQELYETLDKDLKPLGEAIISLAAETAEAARAHDMRLLYTLLAFSCVAMILMLFNVRAITLTVVRPIARLRLALRDVAEGDFGLKIAKRMRKDEFGAIASDIDKISDRVVSALEEQKVLRAEGERVIDRLQRGLQRLASGDLGDRINERMAGEYDPLRVNYNETVDKLNVLISQVVSASNRIQEKSGQIQNASEDLSQRTESQAATLEETAAALEMMTASVNSSANNAKEVAASVEDTRNEVRSCGAVVEEAVHAMNEIEASSSQISQIIGVIDDIAFQTNLLALNAGVEAARAGDVGRGFAVVASEVGALAQRTSEAANEIKSLIQDSTLHVQGGVERVNEAGKALSSVVKQVAQVSELVSSISSEAAEQAQGLSEVNIGVSQLDQATQQNVSMVESSSAAIRVMNGEMVGLNDLVGQFTLNSSKHSVRTEPETRDQIISTDFGKRRMAS